MSFFRIAAFLALALASWLSPAYADSFLQLNSQPGDFIGQGVNRRVNAADATFTAGWDTNFNYAEIHVENADVHWALQFLPTPGSASFTGTWQVSDSSRQIAGFSVSGEGRGCTSDGKFVVREMVIAADGHTITSFAADFEQHCEHGWPSAFGGIRVNSAIPYADFAPTPAPQITISLQGDPGDPMLGGAARAITDDGSHFSEYRGSGVEFRYIALPEFWTLAFAAPNGSPLAPGTYVGAQRYSRPSPGSPGLEVTGEGRACDSVMGTFVVREIEMDAYRVTRLAADFRQYCDGAASALQGGIRINSALPYSPPPATATGLQYLDPTNDFQVLPNTSFNGFRVATVDATGARVPLQEIRAEASCGLWGNASPTLRWTSDSSGIATLPPWNAPVSPTTCVITVSLWNFPSAPLTFTMQVAAAPSQPAHATRVQLVDGITTYQVAAGASFAGLRLATVDGNGNRVGGMLVNIVASCGTFNGSVAAGLVLATSDINGIVSIPRWQAPATGGQQCTITGSLPDFPSASAGFTMQVTQSSTQPLRSASGTAPGGGLITLSVASNVAECTLTRASFIDPATISPPVAPLPNVANLAMPHGYVDFRADNCGSGQPITVNVDLAQELPPTAQYWKYGPTADNRTSHWYVIPSTVSGKRIIFSITDGGLGDDDLAMNGSITDLGMVAIPGGTMQDLWWSGLAENGWGMTLVQHRDILFGNMFVYDANGVATWYVMPSGSWDTAHKVYTGDLFLPKGSPYFAYDVSRFDLGAAVGSARITFNSVNEATFEYTINGISARKNISRIPFGPVAPPTDKPLGDLWWAGLAQNGWGLVFTQQYATLFGLWFTYDANGKATWFVMPNVEFVQRDTYRGNIYRPEGAPWLGVTYDPTRHRTVQVGTFTLRFTTDGATFDYTVDGKSGSIPISRIPF